MRLRVFDFACRAFWVVAFYRRRSRGKPWLELYVFNGPDWARAGWFQWCSAMKWENEPTITGSVEIEDKDAH